MAGASFTAFGPVTAMSAVLLDGAAIVRFLPNTDYNGSATFSFKAWDMSVGGTGETGIDTTVGTLFSTATETASITVNPVNGRSGARHRRRPGADRHCRGHGRPHRRHGRGHRDRRLDHRCRRRGRSHCRDQRRRHQRDLGIFHRRRRLVHRVRGRGQQLGRPAGRERCRPVRPGCRLQRLREFQLQGLGPIQRRHGARPASTPPPAPPSPRPRSQRRSRSPRSTMPRCSTPPAPQP